MARRRQTSAFSLGVRGLRSAKHGAGIIFRFIVASAFVFDSANKIKSCLSFRTRCIGPYVEVYFMKESSRPPLRRTSLSGVAAGRRWDAVLFLGDGGGEGWHSSINYQLEEGLDTQTSTEYIDTSFEILIVSLTIRGLNSRHG